ncbi:translocase of chloroplast 159, chloroplastic-like [Silene latifolia]|uniref:translocase of chloroplast 159, chloroplastic-like n=1 Tax=Silene latifolia TaxID=37657 RepID=UPI003D770E5F
MDSSSVGALEERKDLDVVAREGAVAVESAPVDSVLPEAVGVVDSITVDAAEAARSSVAVVGEVKGSGAVVGNSVVEDVAPEVEDSVAEKYASEDPAAIRTDEAKFVGEGDSVVDAIEVNVVEGIRSGVAVVGESESEGTELETKDVVAPAVENASLANEFSPMPDPISSEVVERPDDELEEAQTNVAEAPRSIEIPELLNPEKSKSETDFVSKEREPSDELQYSGGENEKVELDNSMNDEPAIGPVSVGGEKATPRSYASVLVDGLDSTTSDKSQLEQSSADSEDGIYVAQEKGDDLGSGTDGEDDLMYYGSGSSSKMVAEELKTHDNSGMIDGQVVTDSEDADSDDGNELFDSAALTALLKAATRGGTDTGSITVRSQDGSRLFSLERPAGLEPSLRSARPTTGPTNSGFFNPTNFAPPSEENLSEEDKKKLQNLQHLKVKFLRLAQKLGVTAEHSLAAQVLYKLTVFAGRTVSPAFSLDNAKHTAMQLEAEGKDLDFSLNILVLGKSGVGKSAIINSIFGEEKVKINAFDSETTSVNKVCGNVDGVKIRFIDAPGLRSAAMEQGYNRKVLASVKKLTNKYPPDVMFYVDRLDSQTRDLNDLPLLKTISNSLGTSIWRNAIVTLTHASSAPPDGPSGTPLSYEVFVAQRSHIVQQSIGQAVGEMRLMNLNMMNPVSLVENHSACRKNREGQKILPNGQAWRPQLLLLCYSVKILSEANASSKIQDAFDPRKLFGYRSRSPPLPYLLSSLLQPRAHPKLSADQGGDNVDSDIDLDDVSDSDQEEEEEYDQLPPFKPLKKSQMAKLSSDQKKAYFEEYDYRVKLLQRKQWREELKRMRDAKKSGNNGIGENPEDFDGENGAPAAVPVPLPDMTLPPSFDSDNPAYRYRFLEPTSQFLARPVLDPHGWDHDCGYEGVNVEHTMGIAERYPASLTVQVNKDKKDFNIHLDSAVSAKHGENGSSLLGFDVQTIGKQYAYIVRGESKFKNLKKNKTAAGVTVTFLGENVATGIKVEDQIMVGKRLVLVGSTGTVRSQKDAAYGANLEVRLREADYPIGQEQSSFTLSLMKWRGDLAVGGNLQSQISVGRNSKMVVRAALNNKMSGQVTVRTSSSDHLSIALAGLIPIVVAIYQKLRSGDDSENYSIY